MGVPKSLWGSCFQVTANGLSAQTVIPRLIFRGPAMLFCTAAAPFYMPVNSSHGFWFPHIFANTYCFLFFPFDSSHPDGCVVLLFTFHPCFFQGRAQSRCPITICRGSECSVLCTNAGTRSLAGVSLRHQTLGDQNPHQSVSQHLGMLHVAIPKVPSWKTFPFFFPPAPSC